MPIGEKNPFWPEVERTPLRLFLDARSFESLEGEAREEALILCELCWTDAIEALWSWGGKPIEANITPTELGPVEADSRSVGKKGELADGFFIGGIMAWHQFDEWASRQNYDAGEREWFLHYGPLVHFTDRGWHYLVTADEQLLRESEGDSGWFRRGQHSIASVRRALFLAGLTMKAHRQVFYESPRPGHTIYTENHQLYEWLTYDFLGIPGWLLDSVRQPGAAYQDFYRSEREVLAESIYDRIGDILQSRDRIALTNARGQDEGTLREIRYDLASMVGSCAAVLDAMAVLAQAALPFELPEGAGDTAISLRRRQFRKGLREAGGETVAEVAVEHSNLLRFIWSLRNPVLHRQGLASHNLHVLGSGNEPQITLTEEQVDRLRELCGQRDERIEEWGLKGKVAGIDASVRPMSFAHRLALVTIDAVSQLVAAVVSDKDTRREDNFWTHERRAMVRRLRLLSGIPRD